MRAVAGALLRISTRKRIQIQSDMLGKDMWTMKPIILVNSDPDTEYIIEDKDKETDRGDVSSK